MQLKMHSVQEAAKILNAYETSQGRRPVNLQRMYYLVRMGQVPGLAFKLGLKRRGPSACVRIWLDLPEDFLKKAAS